VRVGPTNWAHQTVLLQSAFEQYGDEEGRAVNLSLWLRTETDAEGNFLFDQVPPGERKAALQYKLRDGEEGAIPLSHGVSVTVKPSDTAEVTLGGSGRAVTGRIATVGAEPSSVNWRRDVHMLRSRLPPVNLAPVDVSNAKTDAERQQLWAEQERRQRKFWQSDEGRALLRQQRSYVLLFETNGAFRIESVPPGTYDLSIYLNEREQEENYINYRQIGSLHQEVVVPETPKNRPDKPFDLGAIQMLIRKPLRIGQMAPPFEGKTLEGNPVKLEDFRGKSVLLYFHAAWAGAGAADTETLKSLYETYGKNEKLVILGLSVDNEAKDLEAFIKSNEVKWRECYLGRWMDTSVPALFGVEGVPQGILVGPDGRVLSKNLRGAALRTAVRNALSDRGRVTSRTEP
jgi:hypothetical protein